MVDRLIKPAVKQYAFVAGRCIIDQNIVGMRTRLLIKIICSTEADII